ncbi:MAG: MmcQ/YjbR family DNA-binding protein [Methylobacteriaceae bacterium]|nr:MmcQ/YjbR family DNA-binding protein [Methylobacteriaceae bacterium]
MTAEEFRRLALGLPGACEGAHLGHADFRVGGRIFATLGWPEEGFAMVKLAPEEQEMYRSIDPAAFVPVKGAWGRRGATQVRLPLAASASVHGALSAAWRRAAPRPASRGAGAREGKV